MGLGFESRIFNVLVGVELFEAQFWSSKIVFRTKFDPKVGPVEFFILVNFVSSVFQIFIFLKKL